MSRIKNAVAKVKAVFTTVKTKATDAYAAIKAQAAKVKPATIAAVNDIRSSRVKTAAAIAVAVTLFVAFKLFAAAYVLGAIAAIATVALIARAIKNRFAKNEEVKPAAKATAEFEVQTELGAAIDNIDYPRFLILANRAGLLPAWREAAEAHEKFEEANAKLISNPSDVTQKAKTKATEKFRAADKKYGEILRAVKAAYNSPNP